MPDTLPGDSEHTRGTARPATRRTTTARVVVTSIGWNLPFALGPPLFSRDVYAYASQGELARHGLDPATHGVSALRALGPQMEPFVTAVDPRWRDTHAPYGSTAVLVEKAAATVGDALAGTGPLGAVIVLRLVAVLSVVALVALTPRLLPGRGNPRRTALVLALLAANPVTAIHLTGGAHLDALAATLTVTALLLDRHRHRHRHPRIGDPIPSNRENEGTSGCHGSHFRTRSLDQGGLRGRLGGGVGRWWPGGKRERVGWGQAGYGRPRWSRWWPRSRWSTRAGALRCAAVVLACLAGTIKVTAFLALAVLVLVHLRARVAASHTGRATAGHGRSDRGNHDENGEASPARRSVVASGAGSVLFDLSVAAVTMAVSMVAAGFGPTWIGALATSGQSQTGIAPAALLAHLIRLPLGLLGLLNLPGPWDTGDQAETALAAGRAVSLAVAAAVIAWLLVRAWRRPCLPACLPAPSRPALSSTPAPSVMTPSGPAASGPALPVAVAGTSASARGCVPDDVAIVGVGGMAVALGSPVVYPWYLAPTVPALAVIAASGGSAAARRLVIVTSVVLCVTSLASLAPTWALLGRAAPAAASATMIVTVAVGAVALGAAALAALLARRRSSRR
ncbi:polyprenol phosphomannose-dependent alpha 1,6 mannosyltransferase MptB [Protofrankia coriariae]|uniref:polyprenol phosphomannose-dependent alpha 1,6 mannosyltransferase MptB n=1 Tax=Protofrankia coriariae TaxID=1562887 RepID=UPI001910D1F1|nr:polyprenol phosphomannose-dependent alpha 1,6 mannosyltransferase MptB [Protofrankia coriariae]